jgi:hypothetical protein
MVWPAWKIIGRCATFGTMIHGTCKRGRLKRPQSFMPNAFTESLRAIQYQRDSVKLDLMHDDRFVLADTREGNLFFEQKGDGLYIAAWMETTNHASERAAIELLKGTMRGLSVMGVMTLKPCDRFDAIIRCELFSVGIVDSAGCPGTWLKLLSPDQQRAEKLREHFLHYGDLG